MKSDNPNPAVDFDTTMLGKVCALHGYDLMVVVAIKHGDEGGATGTGHVGLSGVSAHLAESLSNEIRKVVLGHDIDGESRELDKLAREAAQEMKQGPENDPEYGKRLISLDVAKRDRKKLS